MATVEQNGSATATTIVAELHRVRKDVVKIPVRGITPYIPHRWSEKSRQMMSDKHKGKVVEKKAPKDPVADAYAATYWCEDGRPGIPATAFKAAIADAARYFDKSVTIVMLKRIIYIFGEGPDVLVPLDCEYKMFESTPRNSTGTPDIRYRNMMMPWRAELHVEFVSSMITHESLVALVDAAGIGGVGDWRPSSRFSNSGTYGKFVVEDGS